MLPNFFVIGAPKAGTSALHSALAQHPDIYMSPIKEPLYFACDGEPPVLPGPAGSLMRRRAIWRSADYLSLFEGAGAARAVGESSVVYLRSPIAAARIHRNIPRARIIAILRDPASRAHSHFWFSVANGSEPLRDFERALRQEMSGGRDDWGSELHHWRNGLYHVQLARYFALFPRERILVHRYETWRDAPHTLLADVFRFLEVDDGFCPLPERVNVTVPAAPRGRIARLRAALIPGRSLPPIVPPLREETRAMLTASYRDDLRRVETLIDRDLSSWR